MIESNSNRQADEKVLMSDSEDVVVLNDSSIPVFSSLFHWKSSTTESQTDGTVCQWHDIQTFVFSLSMIDAKAERD